jgi:lipoprotein-anchoring transpeptidase ErfK/SrfK
MESARLALLALSAFQLPETCVGHEVIRKPIFVQPRPVCVTTDLSEQKADVFENNSKIAWTHVATGRSGFNTPKGTFRISKKVVDKRFNCFGTIVDGNGNSVRRNATPGLQSIPSGGRFVGGKMPCWMRLTDNGVGLHAGRIPNLGAPASHGCVWLPYDMAATTYALAPTGTTVTIVQ